MTVKSQLYRAARIVRDVEVVSDPAKARRRAKNMVLASALGALGFWRLWRRLWA